MELFDIGANLTHKTFQGEHQQVIDQAAAVGVTAMVVTGSNLASSIEAVALCEQWPMTLRSTVGVHPHHASETDLNTIASLRELSVKSGVVVAIGECGLDFNRNFSLPADQEKWFEAQLELAAEVELPVFLHQRDAHDRFMEILAKYRHKLVGAVVHCFTGNAQQLEACLEMDLHIGITGWICDERRGLHLRELVSRIPAQRLLIETDAPYLLPRTIKPKPKSRQNKPAFLPYVLTAVAQAREEEEAEVAQITCANARRFFGWV